MSKKPPLLPTRQALRQALKEAHEMAESTLDHVSQQPFGPGMIGMAKVLGMGVSTIPIEDRVFAINVLVCVMTHYANGFDGKTWQDILGENYDTLFEGLSEGPH